MATRAHEVFPFPGTAIDVVAVVASADGIEAMGRVLAGLPADFPAAVVVIQHLPAGHESRLPEVLARTTHLRVAAAGPGAVLAPGHVYVAPPDYHVLVTRFGTLTLAQTPRVRHVRPAGDVLFASLVGSCGPRAAVVVLTGTGSNGTDGVRFVHAAGGFVVVQDPATARHRAMPEAAIATGCADYVLPVDQIAPVLDWAARFDHTARHRRKAPTTA